LDSRLRGNDKMDLIHSVSDLRERLSRETSIVLVPTMGNLHAGHLALVDIAKAHGRCVVASIFVNRLQFEPGGDFDRYPRTLQRDRELLEQAGCHTVFAPDESEMYPQVQQAFITPPEVAASLEGKYRPGHFQGVCTVVAKLFNIVRPHAAVFGKKDYQQLAVIRAMERQLDFGIRIVGAETVREPDGLAMSSRNGYLSPEERKEAVRLNANLRTILQRLGEGSREYMALENATMDDLERHGWKPDYVAIRKRADLSLPRPGERELVVLGAAWLGKTRLIDNLETDAP
jgi:pantoate--beta-alanine ligase